MWELLGMDGTSEKCVCFRLCPSADCHWDICHCATLPSMLTGWHRGCKVTQYATNKMACNPPHTKSQGECPKNRHPWTLTYWLRAANCFSLHHSSQHHPFTRNRLNLCQKSHGCHLARDRKCIFQLWNMLFFSWKREQWVELLWLQNLKLPLEVKFLLLCFVVYAFILC